MKTKTTNSPLRYKSKTVPLSLADARQERYMEVLNALRNLEEQLQSLRDFIQADLPTTKQVMQPVHPGEEGYENAEYEQSIISSGMVFKTESRKPN